MSGSAYAGIGAHHPRAVGCITPDKQMRTGEGWHALSSSTYAVTPVLMGHCMTAAMQQGRQLWGNCVVPTNQWCLHTASKSRLALCQSAWPIPQAMESIPKVKKADAQNHASVPCKTANMATRRYSNDSQ